MEGILDNEIGARQVNRTGWICQAQALFVIQGIVAVGGIEIDVTARNLVAQPFADIFSGRCLRTRAVAEQIQLRHVLRSANLQ